MPETLKPVQQSMPDDPSPWRVVEFKQKDVTIVVKFPAPSNEDRDNSENSKGGE